MMVNNKNETNVSRDWSVVCGKVEVMRLIGFSSCIDFHLSVNTITEEILHGFS